MQARRAAQVVLLIVLVSETIPAQTVRREETTPGDRMLAEYFRQETARLEDRCLVDVSTLEEWQQKRETLQARMREMLGLSPLPERTDLKPQITGRSEHDAFIVERLHFQSRPGLYVTANLYLPKELSQRAPAILYLCGHGAVKQDGVSYGNKVSYQHHGAWFARHGYVCLTIDSLQLGEIEGIHHGTHRYNMWWWLSRGYTPAGVEAWNCVRALDYLETRDEVNADRIGVTGRSGGGAYSWWIAAIDDRVKVAVPVAGITDLRNHVVDGCVEGHCDCMYLVNTYRWDYPLVAALVAPRPLLISNSDRDGIFPLDGVIRTHAKVRKIYELYGAAENLGLNITSGPHKDTQELRVNAFRWLNKHLKGDEVLIEEPAISFFEPAELKVFPPRELPGDEKNTTIHESFVPAAEPAPVPTDAAQWAALREGWQRGITEKAFAAWPRRPDALDWQVAGSARIGDVELLGCDFTSQGPFRLRLFLAHQPDVKKADTVELRVLSASDWEAVGEAMHTALVNSTSSGEETGRHGQTAESSLPEALRDALRRDHVVAAIAPRGIGPTAWNGDPRNETQIARRFYLLGQTVDGMRIWDVRRAIRVLRQLPLTKQARLELRGQGESAGLALYAALFEPDVARLELRSLARSHRDGPVLLNVARYLDIPQVVAMVAERAEINIDSGGLAGWDYPERVAAALSWKAAQRHAASESEAVEAAAPAHAYRGLVAGEATREAVLSKLGVPPIATEKKDDLRYPAQLAPKLNDRIYFRDDKLILVTAASADPRYPDRRGIVSRLGEPEASVRFQTQEYLDYSEQGLRFIVDSGDRTVGVIYFVPTARRVPAGDPHALLDLRRCLTQTDAGTPPPEFLVGAAQASIAPQQFAGIVSAEQEGPPLHLAEEVRARVAVFRRGTTQIVLIGLDVFGLGPWDLAKLRESLAKKGFEHVIVAMSHSHANVDTIGFYGYYPRDYVAHILRQTEAAVVEAARSLRPIESLRVGTTEMSLAGGRVADLIRNGRDAGLVDPTVSLLQAVGSDGRPIVNLVHLACHPEVIDLDETRGISPDFVGTLCDEVTRRLGGQTVFLNGSLGGMLTPDTPFRTQAAAEEMGRALAEHVVAAAAQARPTTSYRLWLQRRPIEYPITSEAIRTFLEQAPGPVDFHQGRVTAEMNVLWIGDAQFITVPGEPLPDIGLEIMSRMTGAVRVVVGLANGELGYLVPSFDFRTGHYEERTGPGAAGGPITRSVGLELATLQPPD